MTAKSTSFSSVAAPWVAALLMLAIQLLSLAYAYGDLSARVKALENTDVRHESSISAVQEIHSDIAWIKEALKERRGAQEDRKP